MNKNKKQFEFDALILSPGIAMGPAFFFRRIAIDLEEYNYKVTDIEKEINAFHKACGSSKENLIHTQQLSKKLYDDQFSDVFESQIAILEDTIFLQEIENEIKKGKKSAAIAINNIFKMKKEYFLNLDNEYFRDRALDIADLKQKLLHEIFGIGTDYQLSVPSIIFSELLTPSDTVNFNRNLILGFVTDTGGKTSHASIMAKSLHIPSVVNSDNLSKIIMSGDYVIIDGYIGKIFVNPSQKTIDECIVRKSKFEDHRAKLVKETNLPCMTLDNEEVKIYANVEFVDELDEVKLNGGEGIGLFRTEGLFFERDSIPTEEEQFVLYKKFAEKLKDIPIILRTVDAGGDKLIKDINQPQENNPFLGWRGIRVYLDEPEIFINQLRAIFRSNINGNIKILLPMISCIRELRQAKEIIEEVKNQLEKEKIQFNPKTELGIMIETPAAAMMADIYMGEVDFLSIGTNDLTQYTLAVDRTNIKIAKLFNDMHPAVLKLIKNVVEISDQNQKEISVCGELAGNPRAVAILLGLGVRILSVSPILIPEIKKVIRSVSLTDCKKLVDSILYCDDAFKVIEKADRFFEDKIPNYEYLV
ncbi:MAG: phosphoenolpyruvate--protein phosphotransferase [Calditrichia bacterium]|nr:phosphoenolpyruvate--protein phosphotransferase [Calditrichia bacterium]